MRNVSVKAQMRKKSRVAYSYSRPNAYTILEFPKYYRSVSPLYLSIDGPDVHERPENIVRHGRTKKERQVGNVFRRISHDFAAE